MKANQMEKCINGYCRSPIACSSFGYCRERNMSMTPQAIEAYERKIRRENACEHDWGKGANEPIDSCPKCGAERA